MKYVERGFTKCTCNQENNPYYVTALNMRSPITPANITYQLYGCHDNQPPWKHHAVCWLHVTTSLYQFVSLCHFFLTLLVIGIDWHPSTPLGELLLTMYYTCLNIARTFRVHYIIWQNFHVALSIIYMCLKRDKWSKFVSSSFPLCFVFFCRYSKILKPRLHTYFPYLLRRCSLKN